MKLLKISFLISFIINLSSCGPSSGSTLDPVQCGQAFTNYESIDSSFRINVTTFQNIIAVLGTPSMTQVEPDGSQWYYFRVSEDGTVDGVYPLCGNIAFHVTNNVLDSINEIRSYE